MATESFDSVFRLTKESSEWLLEQMAKPVKHETPEAREARYKRIRDNEDRCKETIEKMKLEGKIKDGV